MIHFQFLTYTSNCICICIYLIYCFGFLFVGFQQTKQIAHVMNYISTGKVTSAYAYFTKSNAHADQDYPLITPIQIILIYELPANKVWGISELSYLCSSVRPSVRIQIETSTMMYTPFLIGIN